MHISFALLQAFNRGDTNSFVTHSGQKTFGFYGWGGHPPLSFAIMQLRKCRLTSGAYLSVLVIKEGLYFGPKSNFSWRPRRPNSFNNSLEVMDGTVFVIDIVKDWFYIQILRIFKRLVVRRPSGCGASTETAAICCRFGGKCGDSRRLVHRDSR